jgi:hypothetical protein
MTAILCAFWTNVSDQHDYETGPHMMGRANDHSQEPLIKSGLVLADMLGASLIVVESGKHR